MSELGKDFPGNSPGEEPLQETSRSSVKGPGFLTKGRVAAGAVVAGILTLVGTGNSINTLKTGGELLTDAATGIDDSLERVNDELESIIGPDTSGHLRELEEGRLPSYVADSKGNKIPLRYSAKIQFSGLHNEEPARVYKRPDIGSDQVEKEELDKHGMSLRNGEEVEAVKWSGMRYPSNTKGGEVGNWGKIFDRHGEIVGFVPDANLEYLPGTQRMHLTVKP